MRSAGLSNKSADSYSGAINGRLTTWARDGGHTLKRIIEITDIGEFEALTERIKHTLEYQTSNVTGHGMYAAALNKYKEYLTGLNAPHEMVSIEFGPHHEEVAQIEAQPENPFNPIGQEDARARVLREVVRRRGQSKFRKSLIAAYEGRCAITGCPVVSLLEAAHITPYHGPDTNSISNGLLLRADLHTLWDLGLIAVEMTTKAIWVNPEVDDPTYQALSGIQLRRPTQRSQQPSTSALQQQWDLAHLKNTDFTLTAKK